jgi:hypothetical protein
MNEWMNELINEWINGGQIEYNISLYVMEGTQAS